MKCRNMVNGNIVWFGKSSKDSGLVNNYVDDTNAIAVGLKQRLSIIKGELRINHNYGLPLFDKIRNKSIFDAVIVRIINEHKGILNLVSFNSSINKNIYTFNFVANTIYGTSIELSSEYNI